MQALLTLALFTKLAAGVASPAQTPVSTLAALGPALTACWHPPGGSEGQEVTVLLSLDRSGAVIGRPRITYSRLVGSLDQQRGFVQAVLASLSTCTPVPISQGFGNAIAGRPLTIRYVGGASIAH